MLIGVDEVGMGCLAGPVVVCAVSVKDRYRIGDFGVQDSKRMSPKQREACFAELKKRNFKYKISYCYPRTIDSLNIYQAARKAMRRAIDKIQNPNVKNQMVLVDGPRKIQGVSLPQQAIIKGDQKVFAIAAASVIAKVFRDRMMRNYAKRYPQYGFEKHKGYGTKLHYAALARYGICTLHRKSFTIRV